MSSAFAEILTPEAMAFVVALTRRFRGGVDELLLRREARHARYDAGQFPDFIPETKAIREGDWIVAPVPADLRDRRVEITGPVERKMIINALNSGASVFMADFEDSNAPTWTNVMEGQINLRDAVNRSIEFTNAQGKQYALQDHPAVLMVRPRGWHLWEKHVEVDGKPIPAGLFDFGLYLFHNAHALLKRKTGPYFYLPKLESHLEARLWNEVFCFAQDQLNIPRGTIKATVLIETLPAAFEMDEILSELREHSAGLNCGRWDYIFSIIKTVRNHQDRLLPDRSQITMTQPCMRAYTQLLIKTCHRRQAHAMGGMAAQIPIKNDPEANQTALNNVHADKLREVTDGHDGTWVAHPGLIPIALEIFNEHMKGPNQLERLREEVEVTSNDLLELPTGARTEEGLRHNIRVGVQYLEAWLRGNGCVPLYNLMEDAATAEISRTQIWQWLHHAAPLEDGRTVTPELFHELLEDEMTKLRESLGNEPFTTGCFPEAINCFTQLSTATVCRDFLTLDAYERLFIPTVSSAA